MSIGSPEPQPQTEVIDAPRPTVDVDTEEFDTLAYDCEDDEEDE